MLMVPVDRIHLPSRRSLIHHSPFDSHNDKLIIYFFEFHVVTALEYREYRVDDLGSKHFFIHWSLLLVLPNSGSLYEVSEGVP